MEPSTNTYQIRVQNRDTQPVRTFLGPNVNSARLSIENKPALVDELDCNVEVYKGAAGKSISRLSSKTKNSTFSPNDD